MVNMDWSTADGKSSNIAQRCRGGVCERRSSHWLTSCCTTPVYGGEAPTTTMRPNIVEGEALRPKATVESELSSEIEAESAAELAEFKKRSITGDEKRQWKENHRTSHNVVAEENNDDELSSCWNIFNNDTQEPNSTCSNGLKPIGPCYGDNKCPARHYCGFCCFSA